MGDKRLFVNNTPEAIEINLMEFSEGYCQKFIAPDAEAYAARFMELLAPVLTNFVKEIGYGAHGFLFIFSYEGKVIEKHKSIWGITSGGEDQRA